MSDRRLYLLSPYRLPTHHQIVLNDDEMAAWFHGYLALWHPAALFGTSAPPSIASCYDHESPEPGQVFAVPDAPRLFQPEDWPDRVQTGGALAFTATADRAFTFDNLLHGLRQQELGEAAALLDLPTERVRPFLGIGFGYLMIDALFEAMSHDRMLIVEEFWADVQNALRALLQPDAEHLVTEHLQQAALKLQNAREVLYPIAMHLLDIAIVDDGALDAAWPASYAQRSPLNLLASVQILDRLANEQPDRFQELQQRLRDAEPPTAEIIGGIIAERPDAYLPVESQLWNLREGRRRSFDRLGCDVNVFARRTSAYHPQLPILLQQVGIRHGLMLNLDGAVIPNHRATVVNWSAPDGKYIDAFTRMPAPAHLPQTFFNLAYHLQQSISQDTAPTFAIIHQGKPAFSVYEDWLALSQLAPVLGTWTTFSRYFNDALAGEYAGAASADDFFNDDLEQRINQGRPDPVSGFARFARLRRRLDACYTFAAIHRVLSGSVEKLGRIEELETLIEERGPNFIPPADPSAPADDPLELDLTATLSETAKKLADRIQLRAVEGKPGYLFLNPCAFARRIAVELDDIRGPLAVDGPIKAAQFDADKARLVIELPSLGLAWIPQSGPPGTPAPRSRLKLADGNIVRNEFFEAEVDPQTGGLRAFRDPRTRINRLSQMVVFNPGSTMIGESVQVTISGSALGELVTTGRLLNEQQETIARFTQRFRAWAGRPILELRLDVQPETPPTGYPWHAYFSSRFAWGDERAAIFRAVNASPAFTYHTRPVSPDYVEIRSGKFSSCILTGGLPFHQRSGTRMLDVILIPEGESARTFDLGLALDREHPMQAAQGMISPVGIVPTSKGPPPSGPSAWLFHNDAPHLLMVSMRPNPRVGAADRSIIAQFIETSLYGGAASFRCVRQPSGARTVDATGQSLMEISTFEDAVNLDFSAGEMPRVEIDFS